MDHRILSLNVQHGGGTRIERILGEVLAQQPDTVVLPEFRHGRTGTLLMDGLQGMGFIHQAGSPTPPGTNGILVVSKIPLLTVEPMEDPTTDWGKNRHMVVRMDGLTLVAVYLPLGKQKRYSWDSLLHTSARFVGEPTVLVGDFNTGKHRIDEQGATFIASEYMDHLEALGYVESWRLLHGDDREFTWYSNRGNGFRLDYLFASPELALRISTSDHVHKTRLEKITDHAGLLVSINENLPIGTAPFGVDRMDIRSEWNGLDDSGALHISHTCIVRDGSDYRRSDGVLIDGASIQDFLDAIEAPSEGPTDPIYIVGTEEWMKYGMWTDDSPSIEIKISTNGSALTLTSTSQKPFMMPWEIELNGEARESCNQDISRLLFALLPVTMTNRDRLIEVP